MTDTATITRGPITEGSFVTPDFSAEAPVAEPAVAEVVETPEVVSGEEAAPEITVESLKAELDALKAAQSIRPKVKPQKDVPEITSDDWTPEERKEFRQAQAIAKADTAFLSNHAEDFVPSPKNATMIQAFLIDNKLPYTATNLEYAFQELTEAGKLTKAGTADPSKTVVAAHTRSKPMSSGLSNKTGNAAVAAVAAKSNGIDESDVKRIYDLPLEEGRREMQRLMLQAQKATAK